MKNVVVVSFILAVVVFVSFAVSVLSETPEETCSNREDAYVSYERCIKAIERAPR
jgi:hypothetical protein